MTKGKKYYFCVLLFIVFLFYTGCKDNQSSGIRETQTPYNFGLSIEVTPHTVPLYDYWEYFEHIEIIIVNHTGYDSYELLMPWGVDFYNGNEWVSLTSLPVYESLHIQDETVIKIQAGETKIAGGSLMRFEFDFIPGKYRVNFNNGEWVGEFEMQNRTE